MLQTYFLANSLFLSYLRCVILLRILNWINGNYILEQPSSSLMSEHPRWVELVQDYGQMVVTTFLGGYLHWTSKLTNFYSNQSGPQTFPISVCARLKFRMLRLWVGGLYKKLTNEDRAAMEERRVALGYPKTTKRTASGVTGTRSLRQRQLLACKFMSPQFFSLVPNLAGKVLKPDTPSAFLPECLRAYPPALADRVAELVVDNPNFVFPRCSPRANFCPDDMAEGPLVYNLDVWPCFFCVLACHVY